MRTLLAGIAFAIGMVLPLKLSLFRTARMACGNTVITSAPVMTNKGLARARTSVKRP
jgi:hypothetical protein